MKKRIVLMAMTVMISLGIVACGSKEQTEETKTESNATQSETSNGSDDEQKEADAGTAGYQSRLIFLGEYKNLPYTYDGDREPSEEEVEEEMYAILAWFEETELTDATVKKNLEFETVEEFREDTRKNLKEVYAQKSRDAAGKQLFERVIETSTFEIVEADIENESAAYINTYKSQANSSGMSYAEYMSEVIGISVSEFENSAKKSAKTVIQVALLAEAIIEKEQIDIDALYKEEAQKMVDEIGFEDISDMEMQMGSKSTVKNEIAYRLAAEVMMEQGKRNEQ